MVTSRDPVTGKVRVVPSGRATASAYGLLGSTPWTMNRIVTLVARGA